MAFLVPISLVSLAAGVLNVYRRFAIPAFTPVLLNTAIIGAAIFLAPHVHPPIVALAWGVGIGGLAQLLLQIVPLARIGMLPRPRLDWRDPDDLHRDGCGPADEGAWNRGPVADLAALVIPPAAHRTVLKEGAGVEAASGDGRGGGDPHDLHGGGVGTF